MNPDDLAKILDELGRRLGPTGQHVFDLAVRQQIIDGAFVVFALLIFVFLSIVVTIAVWRRRNNGLDKEDPGYLNLTDSIGILVFVWMIPVVIVVLPLAGALGKLLNPEYAAIRDILSAIKP